MRIAKTVILSDEELITLMQWWRGRKTAARLVLRAKLSWQRRIAAARLIPFAAVPNT
jgi:hypothetical protein